MNALTLRRWHSLAVGLLLVAGAPAGGSVLEIHPTNPRWLTDDGGETALVLTGAHTWSLFQDYDFSPIFDSKEYMDRLQDRGHNFTRGWFWEDGYYSPLPYVKDQGLYRLSPPYNPDYLKRLRRRIRAARRRGLYVSVMLFQGWSMDDRGGLREPDPWPQNPYNRDNTDERVTKQQGALHIGLAQEQQLEYVSYLANKLCSEPNILWEIVNEAVPESFGTARASNWQRNILNRLRAECDRHLTWVSCPLLGGSSRGRQGRSLNHFMSRMSADLIAPCEVNGVYTSDPPPADGRKVVIADSDHLDHEEIDFKWAWKAFLRGQHPIFMDFSRTLIWFDGSWDPEDPRWPKVHRALGAIQALVRAVNKTRTSGPSSGLAEMAPQPAAGGRPRTRARPASSSWALFSSDKPCPRRKAGAGCGKARANGDEFLVYAGPAESVRVCGLVAGEAYRFRWKKAIRPGFVARESLAAAGSRGCIELQNPTDSTAVVHLERKVVPP